jgi:hypothetical protein
MEIIIVFPLLLSNVQHLISCWYVLASLFYWLSLQPSLWYKPSVETVSSDPMAAPEQSLDKSVGNCSLTLNVNNGDSHTPNDVVEHATVLSNKGCDALATHMVSKGHDCLATSGVPEKCSSISAISGVSTSVEAKGRGSPMQIMPPGKPATLCVKNQDSFVGRVPPIVRDGLLRTISGNSAFPGREVCKSATPKAGCSGYASLAQTNASKPHEVSAPGLTPKGYESVVPSLALGNSKSAGVKRLNSAPKMTPEGQEFLSLGIRSPSPVPLVKLQAISASVAIPPVHVPSKPLCKIDYTYLIQIFKLLFLCRPKEITTNEHRGP